MITQPQIYLDHAASTPVLPEVLQAHAALCEHCFVNPHASTCYSEKISRQLQQAEMELCSLVNAAPQKTDVIWTSGGTEAANLACLGLMRMAAGGDIFVESSGHSAILTPCRQAAKEAGAECTDIPVTSTGGLDLAHLREKATTAVKLVAVCHVNNETGVVQDLEKLRAWMDRYTPKAVLVVDAVQSFGKMPIPWHEARIDFLVTGGRKIGGPGATGALLKRREAKIEPLLFGGGQQRGLRSGTLDTVGIHEFMIAARHSVAQQEAALTHISALNKTLCDAVQKELAAFTPVIISTETASPYILAVSFPGYEGSILMRTLAEKGIVVGAGSACTSRKEQGSHVLRAMGRNEKISHGMIRISFSHSNTRTHIFNLVAALQSALQNY